MVYLLHFSLPYRHAQHYIGYTENLRNRIQYHLTGRGSALLRVVARSGRKVVVARKWKSGDRALERRLSATAATKICPICSGRRAYRRARESN